MTDLQPESNLRSRDLVMLFGLAAAVRLAWIALQTWRTEGAFSFPDEHVYWSMAESLAHGEIMQDDEGMRVGQMPLYPALLALFGHGLLGPLSARCAQALVGAVTAPLVALLATKITTQRTALLAGVLIAIDPFSVYFSHLILTETIFTAALVGFCLISWPKDSSRDKSRPVIIWLAGGVVFAICIYIRPSSGAFVLLWVSLEITSTRRLADPALKLAILAAICVLSLLPWARRNQIVIGEWTWLTQRTGISLYDGVGPQATGASDLANVKNAPQVTQLSEPQRNRYFLDASFDAMRQDPARILRLAVTKFLRTWSVRIHAEEHRSLSVQIISVSWSLAIYLCTLIGIIRVRRQCGQIALLLAPAAYFTVIHMLFVGSVRYRLPAMPMMEVLAAIGLAKLAATIGRGRYSQDDTGHPATAHRPELDND